MKKPVDIHLKISLRMNRYLTKCSIFTGLTKSQIIRTATQEFLQRKGYYTDDRIDSSSDLF